MDASLYTSCLVVSSLCSQGVRSADSVLPMGLQSLSAFPVLCQLSHIPHTPWAYCEVWLQAYTFALVSCWRTFQGTDTPCSCQKMPLDNSTCAGLWRLQTRWIPRSGSPQMALPSVSALHFAPSFPLDRNISGLKILRSLGGPIPLPMDWRWYLQVLSPLFCAFWLQWTSLGPGCLSVL